MYIGENKKRSSLGFGIILLILGLVIFNNPFGTIEFLVGVIAWGILVWGIINIVSARYLNAFKVGGSMLLSQGILNIGFAIIILMTLSLAAKAIMIVFGIYVIILSVLKLVQGFKLKKYNIVNWQVQIVFGLLGILTGICLFIFPEVIPIILSLFLMTSGLITIMNWLRNK